jgi:hypothetical protein
MRPTIAGDSYGQIEQLMAARDAAAASNYFNSLNSWQRNNQMQLEQAGNDQRNRMYWAQLQQAKEQADRVDQMRQIQFATETANANRSFDFGVGQANVAKEQNAERLRLEDFRYRHPQGESDSRITSAIATDIDNGVRPDVAVATWGSTLEASPWAITRFNANAEKSLANAKEAAGRAKELNDRMDWLAKYDSSGVPDQQKMGWTSARNARQTALDKAETRYQGWVIKDEDGRYVPSPAMNPWQKFTSPNTVATPAPDQGAKSADLVGPQPPVGYDGSQAWPYSGSTAPVTQPGNGRYAFANAASAIPGVGPMVGGAITGASRAIDYLFNRSQTPGTGLPFAQREQIAAEEFARLVGQGVPPARAKATVYQKYQLQ